jgi:hypothetical protein
MSHLYANEENKNHGLRRDLVCKAGIWLSCLNQSTDALGTKSLLYFSTILDNRHPLQVGMVWAVGNTMRERYIMTKGSGLTTVSAFCHYYSFPPG